MSANNERGAAMLAALRPGALVTVRTDSGARRYGRAERNAEGAWLIRDHSRHEWALTAANILQVQP